MLNATRKARARQAERLNESITSFWISNRTNRTIRIERIESNESNRTNRIEPIESNQSNRMESGQSNRTNGIERIELIRIVIIVSMRIVRFISTLYLDADGCQGAGLAAPTGCRRVSRLNSRPYHILAGGELRYTFCP